MYYYTIPKIFHDGDLKRSKLKTDDVLLTITGSYGISAVVPKDFGEGNINQHVAKMEVDKSKILPEYLEVFLNTTLARRQFDRNQTDGTRPALDYDTITHLEVVYPSSLEKQESIAEKVLLKVEDARSKLEEYNTLSNENEQISLREIEA